MKREEIMQELQVLLDFYNEQSGAVPLCLAEAMVYINRMPRWIPVSERLPKVDEEVFVYLWGDCPHLAWVNESGQWETEHCSLDNDEAPHAWMPLPEPYKEE